MATFPAEIWRMVFDNFTKQEDLWHLWTACRNVSKTFKSEVDRVVVSNLLPKSKVIFDFGCQHFEGMEDESEVGLDNLFFIFNRVAHRSTTAIFKMCECAEEFMPGINKLLTEYISAIDAFVDQPKHRITIYSKINDTELPKLAYDPKSREISFDWREAYNLFLREEKLHDHYLDMHLKPGGRFFTRRAEELRREALAGRVSSAEGLTETLEIYKNALNASRKLARRKRFQSCRYILEGVNGERMAKADMAVQLESAALEELKQMRFILNFVDFDGIDDGEVQELKDVIEDGEEFGRAREIREILMCPRGR